MKTFIKNNINTIIGVFLLLGPILDILTGLSLHLFHYSLTIGIIIRVLFLGVMCYSALFLFHRKRLWIPYLLIGFYMIFYFFGIVFIKDGVGLFQEIQGLVKTFFFPILFVTLFEMREDIRISKLTFFTTLFLYLFGIFTPTILGVGFKTYEITKAGTLGFFNSANEVGGIISILTPIMIYIITTTKKMIPKIIFVLIYLTVILMVGTKTPLLTLSLTVGLSLAYYWVYSFQKKNYKSILISLGIVVVGVAGVLMILPKTNFYKNIETHLNYLKLDSVFDVFQDKELIDHFIFSQRLTFFEKKAYQYQKANFYQKLFGIGYLKKGKVTKMIEMDYFDIYYNHGLIGFSVFFLVTLLPLYVVLEEKQKLTFERYTTCISLWFIIFLSFFTGHILTAPAVSTIVVLIILSLAKREKKDLLFAAKDLDLGGIEKALLNLVNRIDLKKYHVTIVLEEKKGIFLDQLKEDILLKECKVSEYPVVVLRKSINVLRKMFFKILNYQNYDFSCCYTTYSYSCSKLALMSSKNTAFYVHNDYRTVYPEDKDFYYFFRSREIEKYQHIIFVSNENKNGFVKKYPELKEKCMVFNNFIDTEEILKQSREEIKEKKDKTQTLLVFVGRLDDDAKKISRQIHLVKEIKELDLWIVGDGPDRKMYEKEVRENNLEDRIAFLGKKANPFPYMKRADYVILTSDYEGFPVTYLEAITLEKEIITTFPTSDDSIDIHEYGHIISKDPKKMVEEVKKILKKQKKADKINLEEVQKNRMERLEKVFDGESSYAKV